MTGAPAERVAAGAALLDQDAARAACTRLVDEWDEATVIRVLGYLSFACPAEFTRAVTSERGELAAGWQAFHARSGK